MLACKLVEWRLAHLWRVREHCPCASSSIPLSSPALSSQTTVYLLDDGRDVEKKKFIHSLGVENAVYVRCAMGWDWGRGLNTEWWQGKCHSAAARWKGTSSA